MKKLICTMTLGEDAEEYWSKMESNLKCEKEKIEALIKYNTFDI
jgi:hypothetical protein